MKIEKTSGICFECKKIFNDGYEVSLNKKVFNKIKLCTCCSSKLYQNLAKCFVPKSPQNKFKN